MLFLSVTLFKWGPYRPFPLLKCCFRRYLINNYHKMRHFKRRSKVENFGGRTWVSELYFLAVSALYVLNFSKENRHNSFQKVKAPHSTPTFQSENSIWISLIFRRVIWFYVTMSKAQMKQRESCPEQRQFVYNRFFYDKLHFRSDCSHFKAKK